MPLLDLALGYDCNLKCTYCTITDGMRRRSLDTSTAVREIERAATLGWTSIAFTGGEPTIFPDLPKLVKLARARGFTEIKIASNGLRYAHEPYLDHLVSLGVNRFHVSMHAFDDAAYERTVQRIETAPLRSRALSNLVARGLDPVADLIIKNDTVPDLVQWIDSLVVVGVRKFALWLVSLTDQNAANVQQLPRISEVAATVIGAFESGRRGGFDVHSLHIPRCFLPGYEDHVRHPGAEGVRVVTPDDAFDFSASRLAGGVHPPPCEGCRWRSQCPGLRADYVAQFGGDEVRPIPLQVSAGSSC